jgi:uncharacterized protein
MSELEKYIYEDVVPRYSAFDSAHKEDHALTVISQALELADKMEAWKAEQKDTDELWNVDIDRDMLLAAAACHDLGLINGRERHHLDSGEIIRADMKLREWFAEEDIEIIAQAAEDHRASGKSAPRSIYGMLVAEADRVIDPDTIIRRTVQFGLDRYPELDMESHVERAVVHLKEKYGRGGYLKLWIEHSDNAERLEEFRRMIARKDKLRAIYDQIYDEGIIC